MSADPRFLSAKAAIVGIGATEFSKDSGRSELRLAVESVAAALADAGLSGADVDAIATYSMDNNAEIEVHNLIGGRELKFFSRTYYGGGAACAPIMHCAMAVASGVADVGVVYRAMNERSGARFGSGLMINTASALFENRLLGNYMCHGLSTPAAWLGMIARRAMHEHGVTSEDFGRVTVAARDFAAANPAAFFHERPITLEDHQNSRLIADPLRLLDCCQESDGACAAVIVSAERARELKRKPALIKAAAQGSVNGTQMMTNFYKDDITDLPEMNLVARTMYEMSGLGPDDIQTAMLYDHFTPFVLTQLEAFGFCEVGAAKDFVRDGRHARGGRLPINTHGGQLGEAYIHGMNGVLEAVRQIRGDSVNQLDGIENVVVTAGSGVPTSGLILGG